MTYSGVYVFGDNLVDAGNALKLAQTYDYFPFTSLPDGALTNEKTVSVASPRPCSLPLERTSN